VINTNLHHISYLSKLLHIIGQICAFDRGVSLFDTFVRCEPLRTTKFSWKKLETLLYRRVFIYLQKLQTIISFCHNPRVWQTDGQTDRWTDGQNVDSKTVRMLRSRTVIKCQTFDSEPNGHRSDNGARHIYIARITWHNPDQSTKHVVVDVIYGFCRNCCTKYSIHAMLTAVKRRRRKQDTKRCAW